MPLQHDDIGVLILAGGKSSRMGSPKPFLPYGDTTLLRHIIDTYQCISLHITVVLNHELLSGDLVKEIEEVSSIARIIINDRPEAGRFYSIKKGLAEINDSYCFIQSVDNPVSAETIQKLSEKKYPGFYTLPTCEGRGGHPIVISKSLRNDALKYPDDSITWREFLSVYPSTKVETDDPNILLNLNTPEDFAEFSNKRLLTIEE